MTGRTFLGLILLIIGGGLVLDRAGLWDFGAVLGTWWPLFIIAIAAIQLITRSAPFGFTLILFALGLIFQLSRLGALPAGVWSYLWPAALVLIGIWLVVSRGGRAGLDVSDDMLSTLVAFGGVNPRVLSQEFQGGSVTAMFGGAQVDLREAKLAPEGATLEVTAAFGGVELAVPADWSLKITGLPLFGAWEDKTKNPADAAMEGPGLAIRCLALFGGIEIRN